MGYTILMIDDDYANQIQMRAILGKDFDIKYVSTIDSALKILSENEVQLVMLDYKYYTLYKVPLNRQISKLYKYLPLLLMEKTESGRVQFTRIQ